MTAKTDSETLDEALELFHTAEKGSAEHKRAFAMMMYLGQKLYADTFGLSAIFFGMGKVVNNRMPVPGTGTGKVK